VLDGEDLRERTVEALSSAIDSIVSDHCSSDYPEDWNVEGLLTETRLYFPTTATPETIREAGGADGVYQMLATEALAYYDEREASMPGGAATMRDLERQVMLELIDQKWREHLSEMDYLREGIFLRQAGQQDPLVAWQREGYQMFGQLMASVDDDYVKIVMHAQVQVLAQPGADGADTGAALSGAQYLAPADGDAGGFARAAAAGPAPGEEVVFAGAQEQAAMLGGNVGGASGAGVRAASLAANVLGGAGAGPQSEFDKAGRNDPCPCGSGKKFKFCHGRV
jgi:preprotein translocase subunit SecA